MLHISLLITVMLLCMIPEDVPAQNVLDHRIDSLQRLIIKGPADTTKINLYLAILPGLHTKYWMQGNTASDSLLFFRAIEGCRLYSKRLNHAYGWGTSFLWEAYFNFFRGNKPRKDSLLQNAFAIFRAAKSKAGLATAYFFNAEMMGAGADEITARIDSYDSAVHYARVAGDFKKEAQYMKGMANILILSGDYEKANTQLLNVLDMQQKSGDDRIHFTTDLLANVSYLKGNHRDALRYAIASIDYCRKANDTVLIMTFYQRLAVIYFAIYSYDKAFNYYDKALSSIRQGNSEMVKNIEISILTEMVKCLIQQGKHQEAFKFMSGRLKKYDISEIASQPSIQLMYLDLYFLTGHYREAEKYLSKILQNINNLRLTAANRILFFTRAGQLYFELKQFDKAAFFTDSAYKQAVRLKSWPFIGLNSLVFFKLDSIRGDYASAIKHYQEFQHTSTIIQKDIADKQLFELSVRYETDQKNSELEAWANRSKLQQETIRQGKYLRDFMIVASCLLFMLLLLAFSRYRIKQKANRLLQEKQDEINLQNTVLENMVDEEKKTTIEKDKLLSEKDKLLTEKEWLMKEINHRVKNNLQVVMSLLDTQRVYLKDEAALNAIHESQHRVHAISLIHKKLYQTDQLCTAIDMASYIKEVTEYISDSLDANHRIKVSLLIEPVELDVTQAVPVGLIINEAFTNAVKYAFPETQTGEVSVQMVVTPAGRIELQMSDNGVGLPEQFDWHYSDSLGITLMQGLARQIDGHFDVLNHKGVTIKISFKPIKSLQQQ